MRRRRSISETSQLYATSAEFCRVFLVDMDNMHLLAFLLTADVTKAEECFVSGLQDCDTGSHVFRDWARSWARRAIIHNAVRMLAPRASQPTVTVAPRETVNCRLARTPESAAAIASILGLQDFERFVFVSQSSKDIPIRIVPFCWAARGMKSGRQECEPCCMSRSQTGFGPYRRLCAPPVILRRGRRKRSWSPEF